MPKEKLEPSQWVVDYSAFVGATGEALQEGGNTITTLMGLTLLGSVLITCVVLRSELQSSLQILLSGATVGSIISDPKKAASTIQQQFQKPVENVAASSTQATNISDSDMGGNEKQPVSNDDEEWMSPRSLTA